MSEKSGDRICDQCHTPAPPGAKFCMECGNKLQVFTKECAKCRSLIPDDINFCSSCQQNQKEQIHCILCKTVLSDNTEYCYLCSAPQDSQKISSVTFKKCVNTNCQTCLLDHLTVCYKCHSQQQPSQCLMDPFPVQSHLPAAVGGLPLAFPGSTEVRLQLQQPSISGASSQEQQLPTLIDSLELPLGSSKTEVRLLSYNLYPFNIIIGTAYTSTSWTTNAHIRSNTVGSIVTYISTNWRIATRNITYNRSKVAVVTIFYP